MTDSSVPTVEARERAFGAGTPTVRHGPAEAVTEMANELSDWRARSEFRGPATRPDPVRRTRRKFDGTKQDHIGTK